MYNLRQAIEILESGNWVSLRFITANLAKGSGGTVMELARCRIARNKPTVPAISLSQNNIPVTGEKKRNPNHNANFTRNLELMNKQIVKVHPILITHINNTAVL
jgi:hypothetical protein